MIKKFNEMEENNIEKFINSINTLFFSWGSDTPTEVYWGVNELLDWYEKEFNIELGIRFDRDNYEEVIEAIRNSYKV
jgi:hypothetical protein